MKYQGAQELSLGPEHFNVKRPSLRAPTSKSPVSTSDYVSKNAEIGSVNLKITVHPPSTSTPKRRKKYKSMDTLYICMRKQFLIQN